MKPSFYGRVVAVAVVALLAGLILGVGISAPSARASAITDFLNRFLSPLGLTPAASSSTSAPGQTAPQYQSANDYEQAVVAATKRAAPAVVSIVISKNVPVIEQCKGNPFNNLPPEFQQFFGGGQGFSEPCATGQTQLQEVGGGSGFIISSDGLIITNKHVVADASASYTVITNDGKKYDATVLARDPNQDLAVIRIKAAGLPVVTLGDSDGIALGETAIAIGNALGEFSNTVSVGVVSGLARTVTASSPDGSGEETIQGVIQTDAAINPGNSGGPLLDLRGEVIGINTAVASNAQGIGFAIPINRAKHDINSVQATGNIQTPYLGVRYLAITPDVAQSQKLPVDQGALVQGSSNAPAVQPNSPAAKAGLRSGDIITAVNGQAVDSGHPLGNLIGDRNIGDTVTLTILRGGKTTTLSVTLVTRPAGQ